MNIMLSKDRRQKTVALFTWIWLTGSLLGSSYFAFWLFPKIYAARTGAVVRLWFQGKTPEGGAVYWPNTEAYRKEPYNSLRDASFLWFSRCDILPLSQRPVCDDSNNWAPVNPSDIGCIDVRTCSVSTYFLNREKKNEQLSNLTPKSGSSFTMSDVPSPSWSDPTAWGDATRWPLFFVCLFLAVKVGRTLGEFLFLGYDK